MYGLQNNSEAGSTKKYRPRNLARINLERASRFKTRDLFDSHARRVGTRRNDVEKEVGRNPYRPRSADILKVGDYPRVEKKFIPGDSKGFARALRKEVVGRDKAVVDAIWLQNRRREANQFRLQQHTKRLLGQWNRQLARFDEEVAWRQEAALAAKPYKIRSEDDSRSVPQKHFWIQDAWTEEIEKREDSDDDDDDDERVRPRVSAKERNARHSALESKRQLGEGQRFVENRWGLAESRPGTASIVPGMRAASAAGDESVETNNDAGAGFTRARMGSPVVQGSARPRIEVVGLGTSRGAARDAVTFSPFQPLSLYRESPVEWGSRARSAPSKEYNDETLDAEKAMGRLECDRIKTKLARHGINVKRGHLERALLAPNVELTEKQKTELPSLLFDLPAKPPGAEAEKKKKKKKVKGKGKKKKKGKK